MDLRHYLHVLWRNAALVLLAVLLAAGLAVAQHARATKVYEAAADVILRPENLPESSIPSSRFDPRRYGSVELAVLTSPGVAATAARQVRGYTGTEVLEATSAAVDEDGAIITVRAEATDPEVAARLADAVAETYVDQRRQAAVGSIDEAIEQLDERLAALEDQLAPPGAAEATDPGLVAVREQYSTIFGRQQDLLVQRSLQGPTAEVLANAEVPEVPAGLGLAAKLVLALMLGGAVGVGLAFAREELDDGVRSREEILELTGLPVLVELPVDRQSGKVDQHVATVDDSLGGFAEAIRSLRTSVSFLGIDHEGGIRQLLVTSTVAGDGKTLVAANLGAAYAQAGLRTVLVSADLRKPRLERLFGVEVGRAGLSDALGTDLLSPLSANGQRRTPTDPAATAEHIGAALEQVVVETRVPNLWLVPAGAHAPNPSELLSSSRMDEVLAALSSSFDIVLVDASPLLAVTDAAALASKIGHVLLVAGMPATSRRELSRATEIVRATRADVLGLVLNRVTARAATFGGYYGNRPETVTMVIEQPAARGR